MLFRANAAARSWSITTPMKQTGHCQSATTAWAHRSRWRTPGRVLALALSKRWPINWKPPSKPKAGTLELRSQSRTARFELTDPRSRRDRSPRIGARAGRDGPRERPREQTWAPPSSARRFVINRFLNAADTSDITPSGLRFIEVRLTFTSGPTGPGSIRAFGKEIGRAAGWGRGGQ